MSSLYKRGKSWRLKVELSRAGGVRKRQFITLGAISKREAEAKAAKILTDIARGDYVDASAQTVAMFVDRWLQAWADENTSAKTSERYRELLATACRQIGDVPLQRLSAADLQRCYSSLTTLAPRTRLHVHRALSRMLKHAVQWGLISRNPASLVDAPRVTASEIEILSAAEIERVLQYLRGKTLYPIVAVALGTGLRRGELLALRWSDVDLDGAHLRVEQAVEWTQRYGLRFKAPKSRHGRRSISLAPSTVDVLRKHYQAQLQQRLAFRLGKLPDDALVFANWKGEPRIPNGITKEWSLAVQALGINKTFHSLRHTHASHLIAAGLDILTISRRLGHGTPAITLNVYGHLIRPTDDRAAAIVETMLPRRS
jgi:integrase